MGKTVMLDNQDNFTVTGVLKDIPSNTQFVFEYLISWSYMRIKGQDDDFWGNNLYQHVCNVEKGSNACFYCT